MNILITTESLELGGMEKMVAELAVGLKARGHDICVVGMRGSGPHAEELRSADIEVHTDLVQGPLRPLPLYRLFSLCRSKRFDCAIAAMGGGMLDPFLTFLICRFLGIPMVRWLHMMPEQGLSTIGAVAQYVMTKAGGRVVALCQSHARSLTEHWSIPASQVTVIGNGQALPPRRTSDSSAAVRQELEIGFDRFVIGMVAGFRPVKRHDLAIQAMRQVLDRLPNAHLLLVGGGTKLSEAKDLVAHLGIEACVTFTGARTDAMRLYSAMDVHLLCSFPAETFPLCITEAMAAGVVPVATRVGGIPDIVIDGETGVLVEPESLESLAQAIAALANDEPMLQRMGEAAHRFAISHFSLETMVDAFTELIASEQSTR